MRLLLIALVSFTLLSAGAEETSADTKQTDVSKYSAEKQLADTIRQRYEAFIDTKPSPQKKALALKTKAAIETFQASYPHSELIPSVIRLLEEVDLYLAP